MRELARQSKGDCLIAQASPDSFVTRTPGAMLWAFSFSDQVERLIKHARKATDYHLLDSGALQRLHAGFAG